MSDEYGDDSWMDSLSAGDIFDIAEETTGLGEQYFGTGTDLTENDPYIYKTPAGETMGPTSEPYDTYTPAGETMGPQRPGSRGGIFGELGNFVETYKDAIGLGAGALMYWGKTISDNRNASQAADAAEMERKRKEQDRLDAIARKQQEDQDTITRGNAKDLVDWERRQQLLQEQRDYEREVAKQRQADAMAQLSFSRSGGGGGGGGTTRDPAEERAKRISASIVGMKAPTTGIVNSNIWGNALNTLQKR